MKPWTTNARWLIAIVILAVVLRMGVAFFLGDAAAAPSLMVDQVSYHALATRLLEGKGYSFERAWYPFTSADAPTSHWSFLQPLYLAAIYLIFGLHPLAARLATAILGGSLLPLAVYWFARRLYPGRNRVALIAAACCAIYAFFVLYSATLMTETFYITALVWSMERALALSSSPTRSNAAMLGFSLGLATLFRQSILPWVIILFLWLLWRRFGTGERLRTLANTCAVAGAIMLVMILPFTIRNYAVYGEFLLLNANAGYAMYSAQHPMHGTSFREFEAAPLPDDLDRSQNEAQLDRDLMRRGIQFILDDPLRYLRLSLSRVPDYVQFWPTDTSLLHNLGRVGSFTLFLPLYLYGAWLAIHELRPRRSLQALALFFASSPALILLFAVFYSVLHIMTWAMPRYRLPVDAVAMPLAALAIDDVADRLCCVIPWARRWRH